ncbi:MAG: hypothetical protein JWQ71_4562 [Pedosphaera sp.]|nr:hypothetical protein [Pedosphaera sp.]
MSFLVLSAVKLSAEFIVLFHGLRNGETFTLAQCITSI